MDKGNSFQIDYLGKDKIRQIFLANGFTIKEGQTDLKDYVYDAAACLIRETLKKVIEGWSL
jgi:hypothetical protein